MSLLAAFRVGSARTTQGYLTDLRVRDLVQHHGEHLPERPELGTPPVGPDAQVQLDVRAGGVRVGPSVRGAQAYYTEKTRRIVRREKETGIFNFLHFSRVENETLGNSHLSTACSTTR